MKSSENGRRRFLQYRAADLVNGLRRRISNRLSSAAHGITWETLEADAHHLAKAVSKRHGRKLTPGPK